MRKLLVLMITTAVAAAPLVARPPKEVMLAELVGGLVGSFVGLYLGWQVRSHLETMPWDENGSEFLTVVGDLIVIGGIAVGASMGVTLTGTALGVNGNILGCFLGGVGGMLASIPIITLTGVDGMDTLVIPAVAAGFATWGFNLGATSR